MFLSTENENKGTISHISSNISYLPVVYLQFLKNDAQPVTKFLIVMLIVIFHNKYADYAHHEELYGTLFFLYKKVPK